MSTRPARILIVDDEPQIRRFIDISLRSQGYTTLLAETGRQGLRLLDDPGADVVILDLGLPDLDGREVLLDLRQRSTVPVIVLTVRADEAQKVALLDAGANDYVTKPFGIAELLARIRACLRNAVPGEVAAAVFDDGRLRVDLARHEVSLCGQPLALARKEFELLALLVRNPHRLLTQTHLLRTMWGPAHEDHAHYLRVLVAKLRHKIGDDASAPRYIVTEPGVGLRFAPEEPER